MLHGIADLKDDDGDDGGLSLLTLLSDGKLDLDGEGVGASATSNAGVRDAFDTADEYLALLGEETRVLPLVDVASTYADAADSGTFILAEVQSVRGLDAPGRRILTVSSWPAATECKHGTTTVAPGPAVASWAQVAPLMETSNGLRRSAQQSWRLVTKTCVT